MANVNHSTLTGSFLHEPKGVAAAGSGTVYIANGSGSGVWTNPQTVVPLTLTGVIDDISTASTIYFGIPYAGTIEKVVTVLEGAISGSDATITVKNASAASMGTITVANSSSAAGDVDTLSPSSNNSISANSFMTVETDGASTGHKNLFITVTLDRT
tara:strand:+ start:592 stop:1062 length:471 start_codon:yes stop_codon:yes gene_type:complete